MKNSAPAIDWSNVQIEDVMENPHKFGCPSFEEYMRERDKWTTREDDAMIMLTDGPKKFRNDLRKITFKIHGMEMPEEHIERALGDYGYTLADIDVENRNSQLKKTMEIIPQGGGKYDVVVNFMP